MRVGEEAAVWHIPPNVVQPHFSTCKYICEVCMAVAGVSQLCPGHGKEGRWQNYV